jgi:hypothetical protein
MKLFNNVVKRQQIGVFKTLPNDITDPKQLDEFQHLDVMIETTVAHFEYYDVADVFSIVFPDSNGNLAKDSQGNVKTVNLFSHFTDLSVKEVAASNRWYSKYTDDSQDRFIPIWSGQGPTLLITSIPASTPALATTTRDTRKRNRVVLSSSCY